MLRSSDTLPILGNDARTQGMPIHVIKAVEARTRTSRKAAILKPRRPHLVLKKVKIGYGVPIGTKRFPKRSELVFLQQSPNYCEPDLELGSLGTQARYCNRTSKGKDNFKIYYLLITTIKLNLNFSAN